MGLIRLPEVEARHAITVLRIRPGDAVVLFDGTGGEAIGVVTRIERAGLTVEVRRIERRPFEVPRRITLAVAMPRVHRQGTLVEKCTELGVEAIWPIRTERGVVKPGEAAVEKWSRRAVEAAKQSGRCWVPRITAPRTFDQSVERIGDFDAACLTHLDPALPVDPKLPGFGRFLASVPPACSLLVWVGPEGGWTPQELQRAVDAGAVPVGLGPTVLRTETAAIAVCAAAVVFDHGTPPPRGP